MLESNPGLIKRTKQAADLVDRFCGSIMNGTTLALEPILQDAQKSQELVNLVRQSIQEASKVEPRTEIVREKPIAIFPLSIKISPLTEEELLILNATSGIEEKVLTLKELGEILGPYRGRERISVSRVNQIKKQAWLKVWHMRRNEFDALKIFYLENCIPLQKVF